MSLLPQRTPARLPHMPALDGLRALAVMAVILYHAGAPFLPGGFLGVELFFVLSGFLITALLRVEGAGAGGQVRLSDFWQRRARRLLPAAYTLIGGVLLFARFALPSELPSLRSDGVAGFGYVSNWWLILENKSYFEQAGRPSLLQHLWSLSVEAQFYLVFPLFFALLLGRLRAGVAALTCSLLALLGALFMGVRFDPDVDPSALYYGTDTRAAGLLVGAALAFLRPPRKRTASESGLVFWAAPAAMGALAALGLACAHVSEFDEGLYRGGMLGISLLSALLIAALLDDPNSPPSRVLSTAPLQAVGRRSYSLYLWHWPVLMVSRPELDVALSGPALWLLQGLVTCLLAELSYRYVEVPVRRGALGRFWAHVRTRRRPAERMAVAFAFGSVALCAVAVGSTIASYQPRYTAEDLARAEIEGSEEVAASSEAPVSHLAFATKAPCKGCQEALPEADPAPHGKRPRLVLAIGDSVMQGAARELRGKRDLPVVVNAAVGRQVSQSLRLLKGFVQQGRLAPLVVVHLGNNGTFRTRQFDRMMRLLGRHRHVLFVNTKVPRRWQDPNNQVLVDGVARYPNASLVDWNGFSQDRPEWFARDGYHLRREGAKAYAGLLSEHCYLPQKGEHAARRPVPLGGSRLAQLSPATPLAPVWMGR